MNIIRGGNDVDQINFKCLKVRPQVFRTCLGWGLDCAKIFIESSVRQSKSVVWLMIKWIPWSMPCNMKSAEYYPKWENLHDWLLTAKLRELEIEWSGWAAQLQVQAGQETTHRWSPAYPLHHYSRLQSAGISELVIWLLSVGGGTNKVEPSLQQTLQSL